MNTIKVFPSETNGVIKPLHGVNNSPISFGGLTDLSRHWKRAGFPFARQHDNDWPHPVSVDIPQIFRNFDADADDEKNYDFRNTDATLKAIIDCGAKIIYRLGTSIEHAAGKLYTDVPKDFDKWADICVHIIRHYNEGWANGFRWNIEFWEIWNETDLNESNMWNGSWEQYYELYTTSAKAIKKAFPGVKVGGPAIARFYNKEYVRGFMEAIKREHAPLDFFSWHIYSGSMAEFREAVTTVEGYLKDYGHEDALMICDEWNYNLVDWFALSNATENDEWRKVEYFSTMQNEVGAAYCAAAMCVFQQSRNDIATYYDSQPTNLFCGIFDRYGVPSKSFYAFCAFNELYKTGSSVKVENDNEGLYCIAAADEDRVCILLSRYMSNSDRVRIELSGIGRADVTVTRTDRLNTNTVTERSILENGVWEGYLPDNGIALVVLKKAEQ